MKAARHNLEWQIFKWFEWVLKLGGCLVLAFVCHHVLVESKYDTFVKAAVPIFATYITIAALLYNRARGLSSKAIKMRSLYAAERLFQAIIFTLAGLLIGGIFYGLLSFFGISIPKGDGLLDSRVYIYFIPFVFIELGYLCFLSALRIISKEFLRPLSAREIADRIKNAP